MKKIAKKKTPLKTKTVARSISAPSDVTAEKNLWQWLTKAAKGLRPEMRKLLHWQRIENAVKAGTLDVEGTYASVGFVAELKSVPRAAKIVTKLTTAQAMFMLARYDAGERSWLFIEVGGDKRYLISGKHAKQLAKPIAEIELGQLSEPMFDNTPLEVLLAMTGK
jgi:hypothetical protein